MTIKETRKYKQTELGLLPEDWEVAKLGDLGYFLKGNGISKSQANSGTLCTFLGFLLNIPIAANQKAAKGQGDAVVHISKEALSNINCLFPSKEEQQAIASVLTSMDNELSALEAKRKKYEQIKQGMMQQLLTGRIRFENASMVH